MEGPRKPLPPRQRSLIEILHLREPTDEEREYDRLAAEHPTPGATPWYASPIGVVIVLVVAAVIAWWIIRAFASAL
jgi:hypothetical protein